MLQQTANSTNYKSALRLHGENVSMGECENIFRNKVTKNNIIVDFEFKDEGLKELLKKIYSMILLVNCFNQLNFFLVFRKKL